MMENSQRVRVTQTGATFKTSSSTCTHTLKTSVIAGGLFQTAKDCHVEQGADLFRGAQAAEGRW